MSSSFFVLAQQAILADSPEVQPATLEVDVSSGKITSVKKGVHRPSEGEKVLELDPKHVLLPGLVE
jgi:hypothetical protein